MPGVTPAVAAAAGAAETLPAPESSGAAGPVVTIRWDAAEYGGALAVFAEVAVEELVVVVTFIEVGPTSVLLKGVSLS